MSDGNEKREMTKGKFLICSKLLWRFWWKGQGAWRRSSVVGGSHCRFEVEIDHRRFISFGVLVAEAMNI
jgi:hypothetical protein